MASSNSPSSVQIRVSWSTQDSLTDQDLESYFQSGKESGTKGDVDEVRLLDNTTAIVTFDEAQDVHSLAKREHRLLDSQVPVRVEPVYEHQPEEENEEIFDLVTVKISSQTLAECQLNIGLLSEFAENSGMSCHEACDGLVMTGSLAQVQQIHETTLKYQQQGITNNQEENCSGYTSTIGQVPDAQKFEVEPMFIRYLNMFHTEKVQRCQRPEVEAKLVSREMVFKPATASCTPEQVEEVIEHFIELYQKQFPRVVFHEMDAEREGVDSAELHKFVMNLVKVSPAEVSIEKKHGGKMLCFCGPRDQVDELVALTKDTLSSSKRGAAISDPSASTGQNQNPPPKNVLKQTLKNGVTITVYQGDITKETSDAIVNAANGQLMHGGGVAQAIVQAGGCAIEEESRQVMMRRNYIDVGDAVITGAGRLPCKFVIHTVGPEMRNMSDARQAYELLKRAVKSSLRRALEKGLTSISIPAISSGIFGVPKKLCARALFDAVEEYSRSDDPDFVTTKDIQFVNNDWATTEVFLKEFYRRYTRPSQTSGASGITSSKPTTSGSPTTGDAPHRSTNDKKEEKCAICLEEIKDPKKMKRCQHVFCRNCIKKALEIKQRCPICQVPCGVIQGNMPADARMSSQHLSYVRLPGYEKYGSIVINYSIPSGIQDQTHPNPGQRYTGTQRTAYLPDNSDGRQVLALLQKAFDARLTFTVGTSVTSGCSNTVVWNDIHHKTNISGGTSNYGYPDPDYLRRVKEDLAAKGIS